MTFRLKSTNSRRSVTFECDTVRERLVGELIHYKITDDGESCIICNITLVGAAWTDDTEMWQRHNFRCT